MNSPAHHSPHHSIGGGSTLPWHLSWGGHWPSNLCYCFPYREKYLFPFLFQSWEGGKLDQKGCENFLHSASFSHASSWFPYVPGFVSPQWSNAIPSFDRRRDWGSRKEGCYPSLHSEFTECAQHQLQKFTASGCKEQWPRRFQHVLSLLWMTNIRQCCEVPLKFFLFIVTTAFKERVAPPFY